MIIIKIMNMVEIDHNFKLLVILSKELIELVLGACKTKVGWLRMSLARYFLTSSNLTAWMF